jgi:arabinose-5-phosphate isomerase
MLPLDKIPCVAPDDIFKIALEKMSARRLGIACVVDSEGVLEGVVTDGDVRRQLLMMQRPLASIFVNSVTEHAISEPTTIDGAANLEQALAIMQGSEIWDLPVVDEAGKLSGMFHLHHAIREILNDGNEL